MKANELRIGNYINYRIVDKLDERQEWDEASIIDGQDLDYLEKNPNDKDFQPIPLTEEWLLKFGFEKDLDGFYRKKASYLIEVLFHDNGIIVTNQSVSLKHIEYIHQLQNLYFALTGEELTIKENE